VSVSMKVLTRLHRMKRGEPFPITGFYALGSRTSVQKAISRLAQEGEVVRLRKGLYVRPKPLASLPSIKTTASAEQVAKAWAKQYGYKLVSQGLEAAYRIGFQTQAPMKKVFWSNGNNAQFKIGNQIVEVRHVSQQKLLWEAKPEGILLRAMLVTPPEAVDTANLKKAIQRLSLTPAQIAEIAEKLITLNILSNWKENLKRLKELA
jgi:hypothetical protein